MDDKDENVQSENSMCLENKLSLEDKEKLLNYIIKLKEMVYTWPVEFKFIINHDLISQLAGCLVSGTVFLIVQSLMDIQHVTEKHLYHQRQQLEAQQKLEIQDILLKYSDDHARMANKLSLQLKHEQAMFEMDKYIVLQLDKKVTDQQEFLVAAGVPGFEVTSDRLKIMTQAKLLDLILRLSQDRDSN